MPEPHLRAADADRAAVAEALGRAMTSGRLSVEEYDDRLTRTWAARTYGELTPLTADLPDQPRPAAVPVPAPAPAPAHGGEVCTGGSGNVHAWRSWAATSLIVITVWLVTMIASQQFIYPWPVWVVGPWGVVLLAQRVRGDRPDDGPRRLPG
ncbi:DUF1707 domain-containing protein [Modestobacter sp. NPDC049651]|uniref:DUF1707 SHOCT-like domain-containing protein n=1 Tax=unclassified Modestobacter TaxID=2643866 RepID=UPI0034108B3D